MLPQQSARNIEDAASSAFEQSAPRKAEQLSESIAKLTSSPGDLKEREGLRRRLYALSASAKVLHMELLARRLDQAIRVVDASLQRGRALTDQELMLFAEVAAELPTLTRRSRAAQAVRRRGEEDDAHEPTSVRLRLASGINARFEGEPRGDAPTDDAPPMRASFLDAGATPLGESQFPSASYIDVVSEERSSVHVAEARIIDLRRDSFPPIDPATAETARDLEVESTDAASPAVGGVERDAAVSYDIAAAPDIAPADLAAVEEVVSVRTERLASPPPAPLEGAVVVWAAQAPSVARIAAWLADAVSASSHAETWADLVDYVRRDRPEVIVVDGSTVVDPIMFQERLRIETNHAPQVVWLGGQLEDTESEGREDELDAARERAEHAWSAGDIDLTSILERSRRDTVPMSLAEELEPVPAASGTQSSVASAGVALPRLHLDPPDTAELRALQSRLSGDERRRMVWRMSALAFWTLAGYAGWQTFGAQIVSYIAGVLT